MRLEENPQLPAQPDTSYARDLNFTLARIFRTIAAKVNGLADGRIVVNDNALTSAPTFGTWNKGDLVRNSSPTGATPTWGWVCTAGGTPGTWVALTTGGTAASFSAHNNAVAQSIPNASFTKLTFSTKPFDVGGLLVSSTWTPPAGKPAMLVAAATLPSAANLRQIVAIYKNGAEYKRGSVAMTGVASAITSIATCIDIPNGTDTYEAWVFQETGSAQNTNGAANLTYFQGTALSP